MKEFPVFCCNGREMTYQRLHIIFSFSILYMGWFCILMSCPIFPLVTLYSTPLPNCILFFFFLSYGIWVLAGLAFAQGLDMSNLICMAVPGFLFIFISTPTGWIWFVPLLLLTVEARGGTVSVLSRQKEKVILQVERGAFFSIDWLTDLLRRTSSSPGSAPSSTSLIWSCFLFLFLLCSSKTGPISFVVLLLLVSFLFLSPFFCSRYCLF